MGKYLVNQELKSRYDDVFQSAYKAAMQMHKSDLSADVSRLWHTFTQNRSEEIHDYFREPALRRAYLGYYVPLYASKIALLIDHMVQEGHISKPSAEGVRVLDLGAGPLVGILASYIAFGKVKEATAVDRKKGAMDMGLDFIRKHIAREAIGPLDLLSDSLTNSRPRWTRQQGFDLVIIAHALNEISGKGSLQAQLNIVKIAISQLAPGGKLLIVEPANRACGKDLMTLRDILQRDDEVQILAPCMGAEKCPLLAEGKSWCHVEVEWQQPKECKIVDDKLGFSRNVLKTSYLLLGKKTAPAKETGKLRVLSGHMVADDIARRYVCTLEGMRTLEASDMAAKRILGQMTRGDLVDAEGIAAHNVRIAQEKVKGPWQIRKPEKSRNSPPPKSYAKPKRKDK